MTQYTYPMRSEKVMREELEASEEQLRQDDDMIQSLYKEIKSYRRFLKKFYNLKCSAKDYISTVKIDSKRLLDKY